MEVTAIACQAVLKSQNVATKALTRLADSGDRHKLQDLRQWMGCLEYDWLVMMVVSQ